ncbi:hypothetical protein POL58_47840 [Nannocystis sp. ncelm1]|uniref:Uncharacterized protein n=2 Tax=Nannocystis radixulma TaxID=2995305 RepID=A0ABT5BN02_9BACT|nr:hypothetical protein [Nannocystis radixulma]
MAAFAAAIYAQGRNLDWHAGTLAGVGGWNVGAANTATQHELTQIGNGVAAPAMAYNQRVHDALALVHANPAAITGLVGADANNTRALIALLAGAPQAPFLQALDHYHQAGLALATLLGLNPVYTAGWELALAAQLNDGTPHRANVIGWLNASPAHLNLLRVQFHTVDGGAAPNFADLWTAAARVIHANVNQLPDFLRNAAIVLRAQAHENDVNLPFGNRAGGLAGHFKKHVLGVGNDDGLEPNAWIRLLNMNGGATRAQLGPLAPADQQIVFGRSPVTLDGTPLTPADWMRVIHAARGGGLDNVANALANAYQNAYHHAVANAYDNAAASYLYLQGGRPKINTYTDPPPRGGIFTVAGFENSAFDFSSGYMPMVGARRKWDTEHGMRLWDI